MNKSGQKLTLDRPATYQIKVPGHLDESWSDWAGGMAMTVEGEEDGPPVTILTGTVDQAALQSLLRWLYSLGLPLISVNCVEFGEPQFLSSGGTMNESYHPFRSEKAKETYLSYYDEHAKRWPIASENKLVKTSFGQTFVRVSGPKDGPPLVLLPGDSENSLAWIPQIAALSAGYRTFALDHIFDNGRSIYTRPMKKPSDFVQWLDELFTALELDNVNLMGHSYGGWQASLYALAHPQRLKKLILLAPAATVLRPPLGLVVRAMLYYFIPIRFVTKRYLYWYAPDSVRKDETRKTIDEMVDEQLLARRCFTRRKFVAPTVLTDQDWQRLQVPTLFLVGENEVTYSAHKAVRRLATVAPHVETAITPDADHHLAIVKPEWVNNEVLKFLTNQ